jgi:hypothetical protein
MSKLEDLQPNAAIRGILPDALVTVVSVHWFGSEALELTYKNPAGRVANELLYRHDEARLEVVEQGRPWSFAGDGHLFRLVAEAHRIRLAHLFDPVLAVHTSLIDPLPHQITAVYEAMLPRQPLRFLLADDPGAGKTIMAGLLIKELIVRGDLQRCLVVCPGSLVEQWQDELARRFQLPFEILTNEKLEAARTGNWFLENPLVLARLDKLARNEDVQHKLQAPECRWDLVVGDEAHKLSATFFGGEIKYTQRYKLGQLLAPLTRHFLLMTATPHNGKEEDFQLFLALLDGDRFEGCFRDGVHQVEEYAVQDASTTRSGERRAISRQMLYVELDATGQARHLHYAPYLDYRPLRPGELDLDRLLAHPACAWINRDLEQQAVRHAIAHVVPQHLQEVRGRRLGWIDKTRAAVQDRLTKEIGYWDHRAEELKLQEQAGKPNARLNSQEARRRADDLQGRLQKRLEQLDLEAQVSALPPVVLGGLVVLPTGLLAHLTGQPLPTLLPAVDTQAVAARARAIVMDVERQLGYEPVDREYEKLGYDIESRDPRMSCLRFLEVKGRAAGTTTITVTKNEILYSLNKPDDFILAIVEFLPNEAQRVHYVRRPFQREPDFGVTSVNYDFAELLAHGEGPS